MKRLGKKNRKKVRKRRIKQAEMFLWPHGVKTYIISSNVQAHPVRE